MDNNIERDTAQQIVNTVRDLCGYDINFFNTDGIIIASTNKERIGDFHEAARMVAESGLALEVDSNEGYQGTRQGLNIPILFHKQIQAVIGISGTPEDVRKFADLARQITLLLLKEQEERSNIYNRRNEESYVVRSLVNNRPISHTYLKDFFVDHAFSTNDIFNTAIVLLNSHYHGGNLDMIQHAISQEFEALGQTLYAFHYPNEYSLLFTKQQTSQVRKTLEQLELRYPSLLKIGIGNMHPFSQIHLSYRSAQIAANSLRSNSGIANFDQLDLEILLGNVSEHDLNRFTHKVLSALDEDEIQLLNHYFQRDASLKKTSEELFIHKNTLQYKLDRITEKSGYNPRHFQDAAVLYMALKCLPVPGK